MAEYIERGAAKRAVDLAMDLTDTEYDLICNQIDRVPVADVAPVVRCEDCASTRKKDDYESIYLCDEVLICTNCEGGWQPVWPTHFCSYGCPRDGDDDAKAD